MAHRYQKMKQQQQQNDDNDDDYEDDNDDDKTPLISLTDFSLHIHSSSFAV